MSVRSTSQIDHNSASMSYDLIVEGASDPSTTTISRTNSAAKSLGSLGHQTDGSASPTTPTLTRRDIRQVDPSSGTKKESWVWTALKIIAVILLAVFVLAIFLFCGEGIDFSGDVTPSTPTQRTATKPASSEKV